MQQRKTQLDPSAAVLCDELLARTRGKARCLVAIAGVPGSGKSTLSSLLAEQLRMRNQSAVVVPMDGFHLTRAQLNATPNPEEAHRRRGAPFTFDAAGLVQFVRALRSQTTILHAPSFDHAAGDPIPGAIAISPETRFLLLEGIYLHLSLPPWEEMRSQFDEAWFLDIPLQAAAARLMRRHVATGVEKTEEKARERVEESDMVNARAILENRVSATLEVTVPTELY
ncbi:P-loop containing nucleoside triphosphate hydrolase protein [Chytriomyces sp. MP71]|nr:P-loop containing nucleoside triphosphate hydrolase protein [Chytriomyces sp. MP71]